MATSVIKVTAIIANTKNRFEKELGILSREIIVDT